MVVASRPGLAVDSTLTRAFVVFQRRSAVAAGGRAFAMSHLKKARKADVSHSSFHPTGDTVSETEPMQNVCRKKKRSTTHQKVNIL